MNSLPFFDCNAYIGQTPVPLPGEPCQPQALVGEMERCGIPRALVYHTAGPHYDPQVGNRLVLEACQQHPSLVPCFVALPHHTGEFPEPRDFVRQLQDHGVRAVRLVPSPAMMGFSLVDGTCRELFDALTGAEAGLFVSLSEIGWDAVHAVMAAHPKLRLVVTHLAYRVDRRLYPLLDQHPSLRIETSGYQVHWGIESVVERFGPERLLFGTQLPRWQAGSGVAHVAYAQVDDAAKRLIAGGNLARLLGEGVG